MKLTAALVLAPLAAAMPATVNVKLADAAPPLPSSYENVDVTDFVVRKTSAAAVEVVAFTINNNVSCIANAPGTEGKVFGCGETSYSFGLQNGTASQFGLIIYKQTSPFAGFVGSGVIDVYCHAGGNNATSCVQVSDNTIVIS